MSWDARRQCPVTFRSTANWPIRGYQVMDVFQQGAGMRSQAIAQSRVQLTVILCLYTLIFNRIRYAWPRRECIGHGQHLSMHQCMLELVASMFPRPLVSASHLILCFFLFRTRTAASGYNDSGPESDTVRDTRLFKQQPVPAMAISAGRLSFHVWTG